MREKRVAVTMTTMKHPLHVEQFVVDDSFPLDETNSSGRQINDIHPDQLATQE